MLLIIKKKKKKKKKSKGLKSSYPQVRSGIPGVWREQGGLLDQGQICGSDAPSDRDGRNKIPEGGGMVSCVGF